jgi:glycerate dehydrogenase
MGVVGFGQIGRAVSEIARAFGLNVLAHDPLPRAAAPLARFVDLEMLFRQSDIVSLHCPLTPVTRHLVNAERLAWLKPSAFLLNTARGPLVDEAALAEALNAGRLAGAGLDVLSTEPPPADNPLLRARHCLVTPHIAWASGAARARLMQSAVDNVRAFLQGAPQNVVE